MTSINKSELLKMYGDLRSKVVNDLENSNKALSQIDFIIECITSKTD